MNRDFQSITPLERYNARKCSALEPVDQIDPESAVHPEFNLDSSPAGFIIQA